MHLPAAPTPPEGPAGRGAQHLIPAVPEQPADHRLSSLPVDWARRHVLAVPRTDDLAVVNPRRCYITQAPCQQNPPGRALRPLSPGGLVVPKMGPAGGRAVVAGRDRMPRR